MAYTINKGTHYALASRVINLPKCDSCGKEAPVQELPAESNAGEIFVVSLCKTCLIQLANEIDDWSGTK